MAVRFFPVGSEQIQLDFHTYLSDGKQQDSSVVRHHMEMLINFLMEEEVLKKGGRILEHSDGCAAQYRCSTSFYFMSVLAYKYGITIDRFISAPGHGKAICDGVNGVTKSELTVKSGNQLKQANESDDLDLKKFASYVMKDGRGISPTQECVKDC